MSEIKLNPGDIIYIDEEEVFGTFIVKSISDMQNIDSCSCVCLECHFLSITNQCLLLITPNILFLCEGSIILERLDYEK